MSQEDRSPSRYAFDPTAQDSTSSAGGFGGDSRHSRRLLVRLLIAAVIVLVVVPLLVGGGFLVGRALPSERNLTSVGDPGFSWDRAVKGIPLLEGAPEQDTEPPRWEDVPQDEVDLSQAVMSFEGTGDRTFELPQPLDPDHFVVLDIDSDRGANVHLLREDSSVQRMLGEGTGRTRAVRPVVDYPTDETLGRRVQVFAGGAWRVHVVPAQALPYWDGVSTLTGEDETVVRVNAREDLRVRVEHDGKYNLAVRTTDLDTDRISLAVNDAGRVRERTELPAGTDLVVIKPSGRWSLVPR